jgi:hypothetical protein
MAPRLAAALALLALVGLASTSEFGGDQTLSATELALVVMALAAGAALAIGVGTVAYGGGYAIFGGNRLRTKLIAALLATAFLAALLALIVASIDGVTGQITTNTVPVPHENGGSRLPRGSDDDATLAAALIAGGALLAALIVGVVMLLLARRRTTAEPMGDEEEAVIEAIDESLDDLRGERDVRRAIVACYARMELALERAGSARRPAEAPFEYLVRILERITANGPAARALTELFERAKFSVDPMGEREKEQAIGALELLRAEVSRPL